MRVNGALSFSWRTAALVLLLLLVVASSCSSVSPSLMRAEAAASKESELACYPTEVEPGEDIHCLINVRTAQREPTMSFNLDDFTVSASSSTADAPVAVSALSRGADITTVAFTVRAAAGTELVIYAEFNPPLTVATSLPRGPLRNSGLTASVLTWPAVGLGPITCDNNVVTDGLQLRESTVCSLSLTDADGHPAVLHNGDVLFSEANQLGSVLFLSGKRVLQFQFVAPATLSVAVTRFTLYVTVSLPSHTASRSISFMLKYPPLPPQADHSYLRCADEIKPIVCTIAAADALGPVLYNESHFTVLMETRGEDGEDTDVWHDNGYAFDYRYTTSNGKDDNNTAGEGANGLVGNPARHDLGLVSWSLRVNDAIRQQRFHVYVSNSVTTAEAGTPALAHQELRGSPFAFMSGIVPTALSVTLRGCNVSVLRGGRRARCYADLSNGVSGDVRYFTFHSVVPSAVFSDKSYVAQDPVTHARSVTVLYSAPIVKVRTDDFISVTVAGSGDALNSPFRMNVFPVMSNSTSGGDGDGTPALIAAGLTFYGGVLVGGFALVVRRSRAIRRIRHEREAKEAWQRATAEEAESEEGEPADMERDRTGLGEEEEAGVGAGSDDQAQSQGVVEADSGDGVRHSSPKVPGTAGGSPQSQPSASSADTRRMAHTTAPASRPTSEHLSQQLHRAGSETASHFPGSRTSRQTSSLLTGTPRLHHQQQSQRGIVSNIPVDQLRMHSDSD